MSTISGFYTWRIDAEIPDVGVDAFTGHFDKRVFAWFERWLTV